MLPNLLATRTGRLIAFCALYVTEGIPLGFAGTALATELKRHGFEVAAVAAFGSSIYLPWTFKFLVGPFVDVFYSERLGRRRGWILAMQICMVASLLAIKLVGFDVGIATLTTLIILHNCFGATQDVAIDALAVNTLKDNERGVANGLMFGAFYGGQALGGGVALLISAWLGFDTTFYFVVGAILLVTVLVVLPMREAASAPQPDRPGGRRDKIEAEFRKFGRETWQAFTATRDAWMGLILAAMPIGAAALGLALTNVLAVEIGMSNAAFGLLSTETTIVGAIACVAGGWISDRRGRRSHLALSVGLLCLPTAYLAWELQRAGLTMPLAAGAMRAAEAPDVVTAFWIANMGYAVGLGYMYGVRGALFMDLTRPAVAATQFTAYMSLTNFVLFYSGKLEGMLAARLGYPKTLAIDVALGLVCLAILPFLRTVRGAATLHR